jgi:hypothetical protein
MNHTGPHIASALLSYIPDYRCNITLHAELAVTERWNTPNDD